MKKKLRYWRLLNLRVKDWPVIGPSSYRFSCKELQAVMDAMPQREYPDLATDVLCLENKKFRFLLKKPDWITQ